MPKPNPYVAALALVQKHSGTSGQTALAKCILSLYNDEHYFSIGGILGPLDAIYTSVVFDILIEYAAHGETQELRDAGEYVYQNFPGLVEMSSAMSEARAKVRRKWEDEREAENRRLYPEEYR